MTVVPVTCVVDDCDRRAAASVQRDDLPGPMQLCFTHTEDFRMNKAAWAITWVASEPSPTSVKAAPVPSVGRGVDAPGAVTGASEAGPAAWARFRTRLPGRRKA